MSKQLVVKCSEVMTDLAAAYQGLIDLGFRKEHLQLSPFKLIEIKGIEGKGRGIFVPLHISAAGLDAWYREHRGMAYSMPNDAGLLYDKDGKLEWSLSEYDQGLGHLLNPKFNKDLWRRHEVHRTVAIAKAFGFTKSVESQRADGKTVLKLTRGW